MENLEVLVTTMHQKDFSIYEKMNLQSDTIIANQTNENGFLEMSKEGHSIKFISTKTRGLSKNRNIAMAFANAELVMFTDDDVIFFDGYEKLIYQEFDKHPEADAIRFEMKTIAMSKNAISDSDKGKMTKEMNAFRKATRREVSRYGVCGLVIKRKTLQKYGLYYNEMFGPGVELYCGEDTIFLQNMINKGIKLYLSPLLIANIDKSTSTWFEGYTEKYFYATGAVLAAIYPRIAKILAIRSAYKFSKRKKCHLKFGVILNCYWKGINAYLEKKSCNKK